MELKLLLILLIFLITFAPVLLDKGTSANGDKTVEDQRRLVESGYTATFYNTRIMKLKQFIRGIDTSSLVPLAAFTTIVGFVFYPLRRLSDTASLPLGMLASSFCVFVIGCYIAEIFKTKISRKGLKYIAILAVLFALHIFIDDGITSWRYAPPLSILWYPWSYVKLTGVNPFFLCLGMIVNHSSCTTPSRPYPFRTYGPIKRDVFIALLSLFAFVASMYGTCVPAFFYDMSVQAASIVRYLVRVVCFAPWIMLMVSLYRCLTSDWVFKVAAKVPKIMTFLAYLAPIAIWRIWNIHFPLYGLYELLAFIILALTFTIYIRLAFRLIRSLVKRMTFNNVPSDEA